MTGNKPNATNASPPNQAIKRLRMLDPDGDSTMHSSVELDPSFSQQSQKTDPSTPRNPANLALGANSELSPPNSQGPSNTARMSAAGVTASPSLNINGKRILTGTSANAPGTTVQTDPETGYQWTKVEDAPGYAWKNQRAREEEVRAVDAIIDKSYMIRSMSTNSCRCRALTRNSTIRRPLGPQCSGEGIAAPLLPRKATWYAVGEK